MNTSGGSPGGGGKTATVMPGAGGDGKETAGVFTPTESSTAKREAGTQLKQTPAVAEKTAEYLEEIEEIKGADVLVADLAAETEPPKEMYLEPVGDQGNVTVQLEEAKTASMPDDEFLFPDFDGDITEEGMLEEIMGATAAAKEINDETKYALVHYLGDYLKIYPLRYKGLAITLNVARELSQARRISDQASTLAQVWDAAVTNTSLDLENEEKQLVEATIPDLLRTSLNPHSARQLDVAQKRLTVVSQARKIQQSSEYSNSVEENEGKVNQYKKDAKEKESITKNAQEIYNKRLKKMLNEHANPELVRWFRDELPSIIENPTVADYITEAEKKGLFKNAKGILQFILSLITGLVMQQVNEISR